ncbi:MAG: Hpt domain-containing protein [Burkholderiaceae bacterium]
MSLGDDAVWEKLRGRFRERLARELSLLRGHQSTLDASGDEARQDLTRLAHGLAGAGGTFGFPEISAAAADLEDRLRHGNDTQSASKELDALISTVAAAISDPPAP